MSLAPGTVCIYLRLEEPHFKPGGLSHVIARQSLRECSGFSALHTRTQQLYLGACALPRHCACSTILASLPKDRIYPKKKDPN